MTYLFQDLRLKLTRMVEFSEAALSAVGEQLIEQHKQCLLPRMTAVGEGMWQKTFLDSSKRPRLGKLHIPVLSTELGYGLITLETAKLQAIQQEKQPHVITNDEIKGQFISLGSCTLAEKAFVALHSLDLLAKLEQHGNAELK